MHLLLVDLGRADGTPTGHQALAFCMHEQAMRSALAIEARAITSSSLDHTRRILKEDQSDVAMIMVPWNSTVDAVCAMLHDARAVRPARKLVFLDYYAATCSPHFGVLPLVDLYVKRQLLRDLSQYQRDFAGGFIFTDFLHKQLGWDLNGWSFGSAIDPSQQHKLVTGWNLGITPRYRTMLRMSSMLPWRWSWRSIAINRRMGLVKRDRLEWYERYREFTYDKISPLESSWRCSDGGRVSPRRYLWDLLRSRVVISPFGWGELCFRDYEAVVCGALLVKPSMEHLATSPNIFVPGETYVSVKWDLSDLAEKVDHYLSHPDQAKSIVSNARGVMRDYFDSGFVKEMKRILDALENCAA